MEWSQVECSEEPREQSSFVTFSGVVEPDMLHRALHLMLECGALRSRPPLHAPSYEPLPPVLYWGLLPELVASLFVLAGLSAALACLCVRSSLPDQQPRPWKISVQPPKCRRE